MELDADKDNKDKKEKKAKKIITSCFAGNETLCTYQDC